MNLRPNPGILEITPYVGGRAEAHGVAEAIKLSANESALGPSKAAIEAFRQASGSLEFYPEGGTTVLRETIAKTYGLDPTRIVCGSGSDELLTLLAAAYVKPGDEVMFSAHGFILYRIIAHAHGAVPVAVPEKNLHTDVDAMLAAVTPKTRIVYLANPNNPTGSYLSHDEVRRLHAGLRRDILLVLDAAYADFVMRHDYEAGIELVANYPNAVMTRTFSKIYGLAALRVGWAYCPADVADVLNRIRGPFNVNTPAQQAAAAAMRDRTHVEHSRAYNEKWIAWLVHQIRALGLKVEDSVANFVLIQFRDAKHAADADQYLSARGLILRGVAAYGLPHCLRLTVGTEDANRKVVAALAEFTRRGT
jgi:histidinol-phosphate aminotransferase